MPAWLKHDWYCMYWGSDSRRPGFFTPEKFSGVDDTSARKYISQFVAYLDTHQYSIAGVIPIVEPVRWEENVTGLSLHCTTGFYSILERKELIDEETYKERMSLVYFIEKIEAAKQYIKDIPQLIEQIDFTFFHTTLGICSLSDVITLMLKGFAVEEHKGLFQQSYRLDIESIIPFAKCLTFKTREEAEAKLAEIQNHGTAIMQQYQHIRQKYDESVAFLKSAGIPDEEIPSQKDIFKNA